MTQSDITEIFQARLNALMPDCDAHAAQRFARYHEMLEDWNTRVNLTADAQLDTALDRHYMDSLAPLRYKRLWPERARVIDVGSGAGFPGLPLAIVRPDLNVLLLDSLQKRLNFLDAVVTELGLTNVSTLHARAEDAAREPEWREKFDVATARAVASAPVLMELLLPFARVGGRALCYKGPLAEDEVLAGGRAALMLGGTALESLPTEVPAQPEWRHCVLVSEKRRPTPRAYPRKAGTPAREPLGGPGQS